MSHGSISSARYTTQSTTESPSTPRANASVASHKLGSEGGGDDDSRRRAAGSADAGGEVLVPPLSFGRPSPLYEARRLSDEIEQCSSQRLLRSQELHALKITVVLPDRLGAGLVLAGSNALDHAD
mgnify:CR=1 FL=1